MNGIPFVKYTSYGNNFVILDETHKSVLTELEKSRFAYQATNVNYGVGSDNFLVIQDCTNEVLNYINHVRRYWRTPPDARTADFVFRMFEPNGVEAFSCGNGLMSIAKYLSSRYDIKAARMMTEIPTERPKVVSIGTDLGNGKAWVNLGHPRRITQGIVQKSLLNSHDKVIDNLENLEISFRRHDLAPFSKEQSLKVSGHLVFTGEPHLVIFPDSGFSQKELSKLLFISSSQTTFQTNKAERRVAFGSWLVQHIGNYLNKRYGNIFPKGINVNFVRMPQGLDTLEYRCFERGINRETLACGTGAVAVSVVARRLNLVVTGQIIVWPHRSRWNDPGAQINVTEESTGWVLHAEPMKLFKVHSSIERNPAGDSQAEV